MLGGHGNSNSMERGLHITRYVEPHVLHYFMIESPQNDTIIECHGVKMVMEDHLVRVDCSDNRVTMVT